MTPNDILRIKDQIYQGYFEDLKSRYREDLLMRDEFSKELTYKFSDTLINLNIGLMNVYTISFFILYGFE